MSETTQPDEAALRAQAEQATPGPWVLGKYGTIQAGPVIEFARGAGQQQIAMAVGAEWMEPGEKDANAAYIVAACNAVPGLLATLAALRARLAAVEGDNKELRVAAHGLALVDAVIGQRGMTDCSTPVHVRVQNVLAEADHADAERTARIAGEQALAAMTAERDAAVLEVSVLRGTPIAFLHKSRRDAEQQLAEVRGALEMANEFKRADGSELLPDWMRVRIDAALGTLPSTALRRTEDAIPTCDSCGEAHRPDVMCPPHEVRRGTNNADYQRSIKEPPRVADCPAGQEGACATCEATPAPSACDHDVSCAKCGTRWHTVAEIPTAL